MTTRNTRYMATLIVQVILSSTIIITNQLVVRTDVDSNLSSCSHFAQAIIFQQFSCELHKQTLQLRVSGKQIQWAWLVFNRKNLV